MDLVRLAVHQPLGPDDDAAGGLADRLVAETYAEQWNLPHELLDALDGNAGFGGSAGAGGDNQVARFFGSDLGRRDLVVPMDLNLQATIHFPQPLDEVVGEGIVVVDEQD